MNPLPEYLQGLSGEDLREAVKKERHIQTIKLITRQTDYTYEEAENKLKDENNNYMKVIEKFMGIESKEEKEDNNTVNQKIYGEIRNLMDTGAQQYRNFKEKQQYMQLYRQRVMAMRMAKERANREANSQKPLESIKEDDNETDDSKTT